MRTPPRPAYSAPDYYDLAFSFRDLSREVQFMEQALHAYSSLRPRRVLELACGTAPHLPQWHARGCLYTGLDTSREMLAAARRRGVPATLLQQDMVCFALGHKFEIAYVMLGSLYARTNEEFLDHLDSVARSLRPGGLYVLDGVAWFRLLDPGEQCWTVRRDGVKVTATFRAEVIDAMAQTYAQVLRLDVSDHGRTRRFISRPITKLFFPQELELLVRHHGAFDVMGWFDDFDLARPARRIGRQVLILRRKRRARSYQRGVRARASSGRAAGKRPGED